MFFIQRIPTVSCLIFFKNCRVLISVSRVVPMLPRMAFSFINDSSNLFTSKPNSGEVLTLKEQKR